MPVVQREDGAGIWWSASEPRGKPAVVLIMGLGYPAAMWWRQIPALSAGYRVITLDNRGAGNTGDVVGAPYTIETMAGDVIAVLDAACETAAHLVGISMGGMIAQEVALSRPDRVRSLALLATHAGLPHATFLPEAVEMLQNRVAMTAAEAAEAAIPFNYAPDTPRVLIEEDWAVRLPLACTPAGYLAQLAGGVNWTSLERLPDLKPPLLVIHGEGDRLVPPANGELIANAVPGCESIVVEGANHILTTDKTDRVNEALLVWLSRDA